MKAAVPHHVSTLRLLAWMDRELPFWLRIGVSRHLKHCRACRTHLAELKAGAEHAEHYVSGTIRESRAELGNAKWQFRETVRLYEMEREAAAVPGRRRGALVIGGALSAALVAVFAAPLFVQRQVAPVAPAPLLAVPRTRPAPLPSAPLPAGGAIAAPATAATPRASGSPLPSRADEAALAGAEIDVHEIVHRWHLCLNGDIAIRRVRDRIEVTGLLATPELRQQFTAQCAAAPHHEFLKLSISAFAQTPPPPTAHVERPDAEPVAAEAPGERWLRRQLGEAGTAGGNLFDAMNAIVSRSDSLLSEAWALRRLSEAFPEEVEEMLPEADRSRLRAMAVDHAAAVESQLAGLARFFPQPATGLEGLRPQLNRDAWQPGARALQNRAAENAALLIRLFTNGGAAERTLSGGPEAELARVSGILREIGRLTAHERERLALPVQGALHTRP